MDYGLFCSKFRGIFSNLPARAGFPQCGPPGMGCAYGPPRARVRALAHVGRVGPKAVYLFRGKIEIAFHFNSELNFDN